LFILKKVQSLFIFKKYSHRFPQTPTTARSTAKSCITARTRTTTTSTRPCRDHVVVRTVTVRRAADGLLRRQACPRQAVSEAERAGDKNAPSTVFLAALQLKALGLLQAFEESVDWTFFSSLCDDSNSYKSVFK